jgi:hypothetical protein
VRSPLTRLFAVTAEKNVKCLSNPEKIDRYIAGNAGLLIDLRRKNRKSNSSDPFAA